MEMAAGRSGWGGGIKNFILEMLILRGQLEIQMKMMKRQLDVCS